MIKILNLLLSLYQVPTLYDVPQSTLNYFFPFFQWNGSTINHFKIERDFGTDYGICCWYTPQLNYSEIHEHQVTNNLHEPAWGHWFTNIKKVNIFFSLLQLCLQSQYFQKWTNANPMKYFSRAPTASKL